MNDQKITVVNIMAVSYSGSTWINLMLGAHPDAFCIGEIDRIDKNKAVLCGLHGESCPIWSRYDVNSTENPYIQISRLSGKKLLIVNNTQRFHEAQNDPRIESRYIWVVRDGRAVVASAMRKQPGRSIFWGIKFWKKQFIRNENLIARLPPGQGMILKYEACVKETQRLMADICQFLKINFDPQMLNDDDLDRHFIGDNPGVMSGVANQWESGKLCVFSPKSGQIDVDVTPEKITARSAADLSHDEKIDPKHFVGGRQKTELSDFQLRMFGLLAGRLNHKYGYPPSMQR